MFTLLMTTFFLCVFPFFSFFSCLLFSVILLLLFGSQNLFKSHSGVANIRPHKRGIHWHRTLFNFSTSMVISVAAALVFHGTKKNVLVRASSGAAHVCLIVFHSKEIKMKKKYGAKT